MEDAYRIHKGNSSFGWVLMIQEWLQARQAKKLEQARRKGAWPQALLNRTAHWHAPSAE